MPDCTSCKAAKTTVSITLSHSQMVNDSKIELKGLLDRMLGEGHCEEIFDYFLWRREIANFAWKKANEIHDFMAGINPYDEGNMRRLDTEFLESLDIYTIYPTNTRGKPFSGQCRLLHDEKGRAGTSCDDIYKSHTERAGEWALAWRRMTEIALRPHVSSTEDKWDEYRRLKKRIGKLNRELEE